MTGSTRTSVAPTERRGFSGLACRVLALPASQALSDRRFFYREPYRNAREEFPKLRERRASRVLLNVWGVAEKWRMSAHKKLSCQHEC